MNGDAYFLAIKPPSVEFSPLGQYKYTLIDENTRARTPYALLI